MAATGQKRRTNHPGGMSGHTPIASDLKFRRSAADRGGVAANSRTSQLGFAATAAARPRSSAGKLLPECSKTGVRCMIAILSS